jgi:hypothetical protein
MPSTAEDVRDRLLRGAQRLGTERRRMEITEQSRDLGAYLRTQSAARHSPDGEGEAVLACAGGPGH